jgi:hypothetical protein
LLKFVNQFLTKKAIPVNKNTLLKYKERGSLKVMKEQELNTMMSVVSDPIENVYKIESRKDLEEIQRIIRIFNIADEQHNKHTMLSIKNLATFKLVLSNN